MEESETFDQRLWVHERISGSGESEARISSFQPSDPVPVALLFLNA
jgi:hypothetical protein